MENREPRLLYECPTGIVEGYDLMVSFEETKPEAVL
jgi:hypothetical protein